MVKKMRRSISFVFLEAALIIAFGAVAVDAQGTVTERLLPVIAASPTPIEASAFAGVTPGPDGRLYGVTYSGGSADSGLLYSIDPAVSGIVSHYTFLNGPDGGVAYDELVFDPVSGKFYGTTSDGGSSGLGTVFSYVPGANSITTLRSDFNGLYQAQGPLTISAGYIFGSLARGGPSGGGAIFRMAIDGSGFEILHNVVDFSALPQALTLGPDGWLYGVTIYGGVLCPVSQTLGCGTIFRLRRVLPGDTNTNFQTLFQFQYYRATPCPPGDPWCVPSAPVAHNHPQRTVIYGSDGWIYGQTFQRNFKINPASANPASTFQFIGGFTGGVSLTTIEGSDGRLYVADYGGGSEGAGEIFSMNKDGTGKFVLRDFSFNAGLTSYGPYGRLFRNASGVIYGTTEYTNAASFAGTVFAIGPAPPLTGKIVFDSKPTPTFLEIDSMNADGTNRTPLTTTGLDYDPSVSSDGSKIAFLSLRDETFEEVYIMNGDGTGQTRRTTDDNLDTGPSISADGTKIAFASLRNGNWDIYVINSTGPLNEQRLTTDAGRDEEPTFSPDGSKIAFRSNRDGNAEIYVMDISGLNQTRLTTTAAEVTDTQPAFSPDGTRIAFQSSRDGNLEIYSMNSNGTNPIRLTNNTDIDRDPTFSPDSSRIAFATFRDGNYEIYYMNADGSSATRVTNNAFEDGRPSWAGGSIVPPQPPQSKLKIAGGNILIGSPGEGLILRSPNGTACVKITIDNSGAMVVTTISCP